MRDFLNGRRATGDGTNPNLTRSRIGRVTPFTAPRAGSAGNSRTSGS